MSMERKPTPAAERLRAWNEIKRADRHRIIAAEAPAEQERLRRQIAEYREVEAAFPWICHLDAGSIRKFLTVIRAWKAEAMRQQAERAA